MRCFGYLLGAALALLPATAAAAQVNGSVSFDQGTVVQIPPSPSIDGRCDIAISVYGQSGPRRERGGMVPRFSAVRRRVGGRCR